MTDGPRLSGSPRLSLVMITRDEAKNIARTLRSVAGTVDEMIVVDTGSTDSTAQVAESFGARVLHIPWDDDFSAPRNAGLDAATGDWILHMDADEELLHGAKEIPALLADKDALGYFVHIVEAPSVDELDKATDEYPRMRLFRRLPELRYIYPIHEHIPVDDYSRFPECGIDIVHFGHFLPEKQSRFERNVPMLVKAVRLHPERVVFRFWLATEHFYAGDFVAALDLYRRAIDAWSAIGAPAAPIAYRNAAVSARQSGRPADALELTEQGKRHFPDFVDLYLEAGRAHLAMGHREQAEREFRRCLLMGECENPEYTSIRGSGTTLAMEGLKASTADAK